jgi:hypothetical protein
LLTDHVYGPEEEVTLGHVRWTGLDKQVVISRAGPSDDCRVAGMSGGWAPNGLRIVVGSKDEGRTMDPDGSNVRFLAMGDNPSWQPLQR